MKTLKISALALSALLAAGSAYAVVASWDYTVSSAWNLSSVEFEGSSHVSKTADPVLGLAGARHHPQFSDDQRLRCRCSGSCDRRQCANLLG